MEKIFLDQGFFPSKNDPKLLIHPHETEESAPQEAKHSVSREESFRLETDDETGSFGYLLEDKNNQIVGFACLWKDNEDNSELFNSSTDESFALLTFLGLDNSLRKKGIGTAILSNMIERSKKMGANRIYVESVQTKETEKFYTNAGFQNEGADRNYRPRKYWNMFVKSI